MQKCICSYTPGANRNSVKIRKPPFLLYLSQFYKSLKSHKIPHSIKKILKRVKANLQIKLVEKVRKTVMKPPCGINPNLGGMCPTGRHTASMPIQSILWKYVSN